MIVFVGPIKAEWPKKSPAHISNVSIVERVLPFRQFKFQNLVCPFSPLRPERDLNQISTFHFVFLPTLPELLYCLSLRFPAPIDILRRRWAHSGNNCPGLYRRLILSGFEEIWHLETRIGPLAVQL